MIKSMCKIGNSVGLTFPKVFLDELGIKSGDRVEVIKTKTGIFIRSAPLSLTADQESGMLNNRAPCGRVD